MTRSCGLGIVTPSAESGREKPPFSPVVILGVCAALPIPEFQAIAPANGFRTGEGESQQSTHDLPPGMSSQLAPGCRYGRAQQHEPTVATQCSAHHGFFRGE
jgi:hypothetical protein